MIPFQEELYAYRYWILAIAIGFVTGMFALIRGIWLLRQRTLELNESNRKLDFQKFAFDEHAIISVANAKGNITSVNDKFCDISGYSREELLGQNHRLLKSEEHSGEFYKNLWRTIANGKTWHGEIKNLKKEGGYYWVQATIVPFLNKQGKPVEYVGIRTDITDRKDAEKQKNEAAAQEIRQLKTTLDLTQDEVYMFWPDTLKFFYANQAAKNQIGRSDEDFYNLTPADIDSEYNEIEFRKRLQRMILGVEKATTYDTVHRNIRGEYGPVEVNLQYIEPIGEKPRFVGILRDLTKRKVAEKAKSEFISTVSHELRTPLTTIKGALGLIKAGALDDSPDKLQSMIKVAYANSDRLTALINDILDIEKIDAGKMNFQMQSTDIDALLRDAVEANEVYGSQYGIRFIYVGSNEPLFVDGNKDRLMQVMDNLLSNAAKFSERGGQVEVSVSRQDEGIRISVKDYGCGIPEEARATIFDRFTQADSSDQRAKGGTGLGLSIVKTIIEKHGGSVGFTSEVDKGTTFYFDFPELDHDASQQLKLFDSTRHDRH